MKNTIITRLGILMFLFLSTSPLSHAQETNQVTQVQPSIMVMPYTKSGGNALELFENDFKWQTIVFRINNTFQERGFRPKDLQETINQVKKKNSLDNLKNANVDVEELIYAEARTDIIIKAFINILDEGGRNSVQIALQAIETSSRSNLYDMPTASSPFFDSTDHAFIVDRLLTENNRADNFINGLNAALKQIVEKGKSVTVDIITTADCQCKLDDEIGEDADFVSEVITKWIQDNAHKNQYRIKQDSENMLSFDEVKIPLRTPDGRNYSPNDFAREISKAVYKICRRKDGFAGKRTKPTVSEGTIRIILP